MYAKTLEARTRTRQENLHHWINTPLPRPDSPVDWEQFEARIAHALELDPAQSIDPRHYYYDADRSNPFQRIMRIEDRIRIIRANRKIL